MFLSNDLVYPAPETSIAQFCNGGFLRHILVLNFREQQANADKDFISKVLTAAKIDLQTDTMYGEMEENVLLSLLPDLKKIKAEKVLVFGVSPKQLGLHLNIPLYEAFQFGGVTFIFSDKIAVLEPDRDRKGKLWNALKLLFLN